MEVNEIVSRYRTIRFNFYKWKYETIFTNRVMLSCMFAVLTGASAFIRVYTPYSPVPFTAQVFVVLLSGLVLGSMYGSLSQMLYLSLGIIGIPWFADGNSGVDYAMGGTGGYLIGFILASGFIGWVSERNEVEKTLKGTMPLMIAGLGIIYICGVTWLYAVIGLTLWKAFIIGVVPFVALDIVKGILATGVGRAITVRETA